MSYYPLLLAPECTGWITLCNYAPNNWENKTCNSKYINITYSDGEVWRSRVFDSIKSDCLMRIAGNDLIEVKQQSSIVLLSMTDSALPEVSEMLPINKSETAMPAWRASLGLSSEFSETSYQGEIDPFPSPGSMLSFCTFHQFNPQINNYLLLMNIEKSAKYREGTLDIYNAHDKKHRNTFKLQNNMINVISLDNLNFTEEDLILNLSKDMCGIPLYFSITKDKKHLSLEHTHPPASMVIHGNRWGVQKIMKDYWFKRLSL